MTPCYLVNPNGTPLFVLRRTAAIGDAVMATVVAEKLQQLGIEVCFQTALPIHPVMRRCPHIARVEVPSSPHINNNQHSGRIDLDGAREAEKENRDRHFCEQFITRANAQLKHVGINLGGPFNCRPVLRVSRHEREAVAAKLARYPRPWVFINPRSNSFVVRHVPTGVWYLAARTMIGTKFWMGTDPAPVGIVDLRCRTVDCLTPLLSVADMLVTVDTGPMHIAAAMGVPVLVILQSSSPDMHLSDQRDWSMIAPAGLTCLHCMERVCPKNRQMPPCQNIAPEYVAASANAKVQGLSDGQVSAVIPTYRAPAARLNRVIEALMPQVAEVIVTRALDGVFPIGAMTHPKVRYVVKQERGIGFGRNVNFGVRHTLHEWVLVINDDCYLNAGAVHDLMREARPDIGVLTPLIRFPDGRVYGSTYTRAAGDLGWHPVDHMKHDHHFKETTEMEFANGCCFLVRRKAFFDAAGFDEEFFAYAEDDALSMQIRRAGWRIVFVPRATAIHDGSQTTRSMGDLAELTKRSGAIFQRKWQAYFTHNRNRVPLGNFDWCKA